MPRHHDDIGGGTLLIPNTVGIVRGCQQPEYATQFVEFLLSNEVAINPAGPPSSDSKVVRGGHVGVNSRNFVCERDFKDKSYKKKKTSVSAIVGFRCVMEK